MPANEPFRLSWVIEVYAVDRQRILFLAELLKSPPGAKLKEEFRRLAINQGLERPKIDFLCRLVRE